MNQSLPVVVIIGGGFGGLAAAKALARTPAQVVLIDRNNHHLFQPLLYQVATSVLPPGHIGSPLRDILGKHKNITVVMGEVSGVNLSEKYVLVSDPDRTNVPIHYDYLILATGATRPRTSTYSALHAGLLRRVAHASTVGSPTL